MKFETKFAPGDRVWYILSSHISRKVLCKACAATGSITSTTGVTFICPRCSGKTFYTEAVQGEWWSLYDPWDAPFTLTNLEIKATSPHLETYRDEPPLRITYQRGAYGVRYSNVMDEENLFHTKEEAEAACLERNKGIVMKDEI